MYGLTIILFVFMVMWMFYHPYWIFVNAAYGLERMVDKENKQHFNALLKINQAFQVKQDKLFYLLNNPIKVFAKKMLLPLTVFLMIFLIMRNRLFVDHYEANQFFFYCATRSIYIYLGMLFIHFILLDRYKIKGKEKVIEQRVKEQRDNAKFIHEFLYPKPKDKGRNDHDDARERL